MKVIDEPRLKAMHGPGYCEWCGKPVRSRDPHHLWTRGSGRLDIAVNLIALCTVFSGGDNCHAEVHSGHISREDLLAMVATREDVRQDQIEEVVWMLRRLPKRPTESEIAAELRELRPGARALARRTLDEIPVEQQYWRVVA